MKARYYFSDHNDERCYTIKFMLEWMKDEGMENLTVYPAKMMVGDGYFFCTFYRECGLVGEGCGKVCKEYLPRNGKNGRCKYSNNCYEPDYENMIILTTKTKRNEKKHHINSLLPVRA